jgi:threonine/homoserine/homoserine lactone efflux protein
VLAAVIIGFLFGFVGSMPVAGPIAVLVFTRSVQDRGRSAVSIAVGGALAEAIYAFLAFWGLSSLLQAWPMAGRVASALAAVILLALGVMFIVSPIKEGEARREGLRDRARHGFALGFGITALNPALIGTWSAATTTLFGTGLIEPDPGLALPFSASAAVGIVAWFALLVALIRRMKERFHPRTLGRVVQGMGVFLVVIGLGFAWRAVDAWISAS